VKARLLAFIGLTCVYWLVGTYVWLLTITAPCGLAPGAWCDENPPRIGLVLAALGTTRLVIILTGVYAAAVWLFFRRRKVR
jgi:hypothetical protein